MPATDEIVVRVPKGFRGTVTVKAEGEETVEQSPEPSEEDLVFPYAEEEGNYMSASDLPPEVDEDLVATRTIDGIGVRSLAHLTPASHLDVIRGLVRSIHSSVDEKNPGHRIKILEVGPWVGESTVALCQGMLPHGGVVTCVDTFRGTLGGYLEDVVEQAGGSETIVDLFRKNTAAFKERISLLQMTSMQAARDLQHKQDLIFLDGCYEPTAISDDIKCWSEYLENHGVLAGQAVGEHAAKALESTQKSLSLFGCQLKFYEDTFVWAVSREQLHLTEPIFVPPEQ